MNNISSAWQGAMPTCHIQQRTLIISAAFHSRPVVPSNKPVRSRKLPPEEHDPETLGLSDFHYPSWDLEFRSNLPSCRDVDVLPAYSNVLESTHDEQSPRQLVPNSGQGYMARAEEAQAHIARHRMPKLWELFGLDASYAEDFFRGPDYRYAVDDHGNIQDMVIIKRQRIPQPFQHAITSQATIQTEPSDSTADISIAQPEVTQAASQQANRPINTLAQEAAQQANAAERQHRTGAYLWGGPLTVSVVSDNYLDELDVIGSQSGNAQGTGVGRQQHRRRRGQAGEAVQGSGRWPRTWSGQQPQQQLVISTPRLTNQASQADNAQARQPKIGELGLHESMQTQLLAPSKKQTDQRSTQSQQEQQQQQQGQGNRQQRLSDNNERYARVFTGAESSGAGDAAGRIMDRPLRAYPYCIGPRETFQGLWELDLLQQLEFTDNLDMADLVLHKRAKPKERQFAYDRLRARAKKQGIPFVTVKDGGATELAASLIPVLQLYRGQITTQEVIRLYGTDGVGKLKQRIRI